MQSASAVGQLRVAGLWKMSHAQAGARSIAEPRLPSTSRASTRIEASEESKESEVFVAADDE